MDFDSGIRTVSRISPEFLIVLMPRRRGFDAAPAGF
jgi:hypothetical protein